MCRNIMTLFNFEPTATEQEIRDAALQFVRKVCGFMEQEWPGAGLLRAHVVSLPGRSLEAWERG